MNNSTDRDALARRVFDAAICHPNLEPIDALNDWLRLLAGIGGYLACSSQCVESGNPPLEEHLSAIGAATEKAAKIAYALSCEVESELNRLSKLADANGRGEAA